MLRLFGHTKLARSRLHENTLAISAPNALTPARFLLSPLVRVLCCSRFCDGLASKADPVPNENSYGISGRLPSHKIRISQRLGRLFAFMKEIRQVDGNKPAGQTPGRLQPDSQRTILKWALALARLLVELGPYNAQEAMRAYVSWLESSPFDCGHTVSMGLGGSPNAEPSEWRADAHQPARNLRSTKGSRCGCRLGRARCQSHASPSSLPGSEPTFRYGDRPCHRNWNQRAQAVRASCFMGRKEEIPFLNS